jgi:hypothetical protein
MNLKPIVMLFEKRNQRLSLAPAASTRGSLKSGALPCPDVCHRLPSLQLTTTLGSCSCVATGNIIIRSSVVHVLRQAKHQFLSYEILIKIYCTRYTLRFK